jgi:CBS domain-containing protein/nucleotide-binding universal stress UspA family protein
MPTLELILVPFDYSAPSEAALLFAGDLARTYQARLLVYHFMEAEALHTLGDHPVVKGEPVSEETERLRVHVERLLATGERTPAHEIAVAWGSPVLHIVDTAIERKADLIVMGTHGGSGHKHILLGSVAERTVRLAPCPVLTMRGASAVPAATSTQTRAVARPGEVAAMMSPSPVTVTPDDSLETARRRMRAARIRHLPVLDGERLVGILSDIDFASYAGEYATTRVATAMTPEPLTIAADAAVSAAARLMLERRVRALPVVEDGRLLGMLSATDILEDYVRASRTRG